MSARPVYGYRGNMAMEKKSAIHALGLWCRMDAGFGLSETPVPRALLRALESPTVAVGPGAARPITGGQNRSAAGYTAPARSAGYTTAETSTGNIPEASMAPRSVKSVSAAASAVTESSASNIPQVTVMPPRPAGKIPELSPVSPAEKVNQMAELEAAAAADLAQYFSASATRVVFGEGDVNAAMMFIGEGPGVDEDRLGRPFVGRSGQLLDKMIVAIGLTRQGVYIANVVKLRCADWDAAGERFKDRPPTVSEAAMGICWLHRQIEIVRPKVIVTLGASAIRHLLGEIGNLSAIRGKWRDYRGIPVMPTYHPAFLLRAYTEENRRTVWNDLKAAQGKT